jgi:hypothetical protein
MATDFCEYDDELFRQLIDRCLEQTRKVLHNEKRLTTLDRVAHTYEDKYRIADFMAMSTIACSLNCFSTLGLSAQDLSKLVSWSQCLDVTLTLKVAKDCVFVKEAKRELEDTTKYQTETSGEIGFSLVTRKVITTVTEYFFLFTARYELVAYRGVGDSTTDRIVLQSRSSEQEIVTQCETCPYGGSTSNHFDLNISWLLRQIDSQSTRATFSIDRNRDDCHTPARNKDILEALTFFFQAGDWANHVQECFRHELFQVQLNSSIDHVKQDLSAMDGERIFVPVLPLVSDNEYSASASLSQLKSESESEFKIVPGEERLTSGDASLINIEPIDRESPMMLTDAVVNQLISESARSLQVTLDSLIPLFPPSTGKAIISIAEAKLIVSLDLMKIVSTHLVLGITYIENMLQEQLVAAVGKTLQPSDFAEYMRYHNRKLFKEEFQPRPFSHAVRRTAQHSPEGSIRIEEQAGDSMSEPIYTACSSRSQSNAAPMQFALDASTNVTFGGDRHLHTYLAHSFSGEEPPSLKLVAQARQFSCFIVLVGRIVSATVFEPKYGMIVQNKDEIIIPLDLEQIPTPKQFRDAIESLSPEQQRFAKAFRGMQLASTLFGVLVLQIKPQLEMVLKLSTDILTKEIKLTQDLMEMFIKYQIPSDLLSFDEVTTTNASPVDRLNVVKQHVVRMREMISASKEQEIEEKEQQRAYNRERFAPDMCRRMKLAPCAPSSAPGCGRRSMQQSGGGGAVAFGGPPSAVKASCLEISTSSARDKGGRDTERESTPANSPPVVNQNDASSSVSVAVQGLSDGEMVDYTKFPSLLDRRYEELDSDSVLRPTIINPGSVWSKKSFKSLMSEAETKSLHTDDQVLEKNAAFDLLDALTKSGALVMHSASLHVVIAASHCFDKSLMDTVVQGNVNPIERVERSALIMASTIHELPACDLISENQRSRVLTYSPQLEERICE